jgi:hypothetical protein
MSCVAAKKLSMKNTAVINAMFMEFIKLSICAESISMKNPIKYCIGINHVFLLPNFSKYNESTRGAQKSFKLNGQIAEINRIWQMVIFYPFPYICDSIPNENMA